MTEDQKKWAKSIVQRFMDGELTTAEEQEHLSTACTMLGTTLTVVRACRRSIPRMGRGRSRSIVLIPTGGQRRNWAA